MAMSVFLYVDDVSFDAIAVLLCLVIISCVESLLSGHFLVNAFVDSDESKQLFDPFLYFRLMEGLFMHGHLFLNKARQGLPQRCYQMILKSH